MRTREIAEAFLAGINVLDLDDAAPYCADNFTYSGPVPKPVSVQEWRGLAALFRTAFPDWSFNARVERVEGDVVHVTAQVTGTHTGNLDLTALDIGIIPVTGKSISLPQGTGRVTLEGDKVVNLHFDVVPGAGIPGILAQLGVEKP